MYKNFNELKVNFQDVRRKREKSLFWEMHTLYNDEYGYIQDFKIKTVSDNTYQYEVGFDYNQFIQDEVNVALTVGKKYNDLVLKGGVINSSPGLGLEFKFKPVKLTGEIFNLSGDDGPFFRGSLGLFIFRNFELSFYYLSSDSDLIYGGIGFYFDNDDLERIFRVLPVMKKGD